MTAAWIGVEAGGLDVSESDEYYVRPFTILSDLGHPEEFLVTPEGYVRGHTGTLEFEIGAPARRLDQRVKRLRGGSEPIVEWSQEVNGVRYEFQALALTARDLTLVPYRFSYNRVPVSSAKPQTPTPLREVWSAEKIANLIAFIRVTAHNTSSRPAAFHIGVSYRPSRGEDPIENLWMQVGHDSHLRRLFPAAGRRFTLSADRRWIGDASAVIAAVSPPSQGDAVPAWSGELAPGERYIVDIFFPYIDHPPDDAPLLAALNFEAALDQKQQAWERLRRHVVGLILPDTRAQDTFYASLGYLTEGCLDHVKGRWIVKANPVQYDQCYIRDGSFIVEALDVCGLHDLAEAALQNILERQTPDGQFISQPGQVDANGMALYALAQHARLSGRRAWGRQVMPAVRRSVEWFDRYRAGGAPSPAADDDDVGLLPPSTIGDNEQLENARLVGDNIWALAGLEGAAWLAGWTGHKRLSTQWDRKAGELRRALRSELESAATRNDGVLPPSLEGRSARMAGQDAPDRPTGLYGSTYGFDWGNLCLMYPGRLFRPGEPVTMASLDYFLSLLDEGLFPYPEGGNRRLLHHYLSFDLMTALMLAGNDEPLETMLDEGILGHTSAAGAGCERLNADTRDFQPPSNITPHGTFAAKYILFVRRMLVMENESEGTLEFLQFLPRRWTRPGGRLAVDHCPTAFGSVSFEAVFSQDLTIFRLHADHWREPPRSLIVHAPAGWIIKDADGQGAVVSVDSTRRTVHCPPEITALTLTIRR
ncbi:MAG: hypothetical protein Kow0059_17730 [Candidatus Sumerlaeia bacterium]